MMQPPSPQLALIAWALLATSCAPPAALDTRAAEEALIRMPDAQWSATASKNDLAGTVAFYSDDAVPAPAQRADRQGFEKLSCCLSCLLGPNTSMS